MSIEKILKLEINKFKKEATKHKKQYRIVQTTVIVLLVISALASAISASHNKFSFVISLLNVFISSLIVAINSWIEMRKSFELWKTETSIYHELVDIEREIKFHKNNKTWSQQKELNAFHQINSTIKKGSSDWNNIQKIKN